MIMWFTGHVVEKPVLQVPSHGASYCLELGSINTHVVSCSQMM